MITRNQTRYKLYKIIKIDNINKLNYRFMQLYENH